MKAVAAAKCINRCSILFLRRLVVFERRTMLLVILAVTALFAMVGTTIAAQKGNNPKSTG